MHYFARPALLHKKKRREEMKKEQIYTVQAAFSVAGAWLSDKLGILYPMFVVFIIMMVADQFSGMAASKREALDHPNDPDYGWSSIKWRKGIYKKFGYILTVCAAMVVDFIIFQCAGLLGVDIKTNTLFSLLCTVWFILNELLSITENAGRMGAQLPEFLIRVLAVLKNKVEEQGNATVKESEEK